jgi:hypothetical protein
VRFLWKFDTSEKVRNLSPFVSIESNVASRYDAKRSILPKCRTMGALSSSVRKEVLSPLDMSALMSSWCSSELKEAALLVVVLMASISSRATPASLVSLTLTHTSKSTPSSSGVARARMIWTCSGSTPSSTVTAAATPSETVSEKELILMPETSATAFTTEPGPCWR